ncbi:MAG TPA: hypothetical protein VGM56_10275 [Byssovorax sp.]|jgi:hypothetical protein
MGNKNDGGPRALAAVCVALAVLGTAGAAAAQTTNGEPKKADDHYAYVFTDELLQGNNHGAADTQIHVMRGGMRDRLLRPRVQFVTEMLKSVENM